MARKARARSLSGMYHIILKGNNRLILTEDADCAFFTTLLRQTAEHDLMECYAYCLFPECVHLVIKEGLRHFGESIKTLTSKYAVYANDKYERSGKLFYDRFLSEPLETESDLVDAVRFVHRLPLSENQPLTYPYSSYNAYKTRKGLYSDSLLFLLDDSVFRFAEEMEQPPARAFLTGIKKTPPTDDEVRAHLLRLTAHLTPESAASLDAQTLGSLVFSLQEQGASLRQIARILHVNKSTVERASKVAHKEAE
ncbi:MAG: hypothetical protein K2M95_06070 [Clostridiales bacterium]|nr:hypothetical protein [Clostridiales bacterium]